MASALLSKAIADYNNKLPDLLAELDRVPNLRVITIDTEQPLENSFKEITAIVEPTVITVRSSGSDAANEAQERIQNEMMQKGFIGLDVNELMKTFLARGIEIDEQRGGAHLITAVLRKIIFNGQTDRNQILLIGWPLLDSDAEVFEENCSKIATVIYATAKGKQNIEIANPDETTLDTVFARQFRLRTMNDWDESTFEEHLGRKVSWGIVTGRQYGGIELVGAELNNCVSGHEINMNAVSEQLKKAKGTEEEPFEGEVPLEEVEQAIIEDIFGRQDQGQKHTYIFKSWLHKTSEEFLQWACDSFGAPNFSVHCACDKKTAEERYKKENESEEVPEEVAGEIDDSGKRSERANAEIQ